MMRPLLLLSSMLLASSSAWSAPAELVDLEDCLTVDETTAVTICGNRPPPEAYAWFEDRYRLQPTDRLASLLAHPRDEDVPNLLALAASERDLGRWATLNSGVMVPSTRGTVPPRPPRSVLRGALRSADSRIASVALRVAAHHPVPASWIREAAESSSDSVRATAIEEHPGIWTLDEVLSGLEREPTSGLAHGAWVKALFQQNETAKDPAAEVWERLGHPPTWRFIALTQGAPWGPEWVLIGFEKGLHRPETIRWFAEHGPVPEPVERACAEAFRSRLLPTEDASILRDEQLACWQLWRVRARRNLTFEEAQEMSAEHRRTARD